MKKVFTYALGLAMLGSATTAMAKISTVSSKAEFTAAWEGASNTIGACDTIIIKYVDNGINTGSYKNTNAPQYGKIYIIGECDENGNKPILATGLEFRTNTENSDLSLVIENVNFQYRAGATATSGQIIYANKQAVYMDSLVIRNCEVTNYARTFFRSVPTDADSLGVVRYGYIKHFEVSDCKIHYANISSGNTWAFVVMGSPFDEMVMKNNTFYDMPYLKQVFAMSYINPEFCDQPDVAVTIENNDFMFAHASGNPLFQFDNCVGQMSNYSISNNFFLYPNWENDFNRASLDSVGNPSTNVGQILRLSYGFLTEKNNVVSDYYKPIITGQKLDVDGEGAWLSADTTAYLTMSGLNMDWSDFASAESGDFSLWNGLAAYTAGVDGAPIGDVSWYTDIVKTKVSFTVAIQGSKSAAVTITPAKEQYFVGDEVTLTVDLKGSLNTFTGWSDGNMDLSREFMLTGDLALTANFVEMPYVAVWDFSSTVKNAVTSQAADYAAVEGTALNFMTWNGESYVDSIGNIGFRNNKFAEDTVIYGLQIKSELASLDPIALGHPNFVYVTLPTTGYKDLTVKAYVGTDNVTSARQICEYSLDGATWTEAGTVTLSTTRAWVLFDVALPEACNNQEKVYIRFISDPTGELIIDEAVAAGEVDPSAEFTYVGTIYILANTDTSIESLAGDAVAADKNAPIYDLMGRKVLQMEAGRLYIQSGKKFVQK